MQKTLLSGKIHRATVTDANLHYEGSITIDTTLMKAANMQVHEKVQVVNINNGARFETYIIPGKADSGVICLNGAASRLVQKGDMVIIISYLSMSIAEANTHQPSIVMVDEQNRIVTQHAEVIA